MFTVKRAIAHTLFVLVLFSTALAQENRAPVETPREPIASVPAGPLVTATATAERVRFVSPGTVVQLRLEVYNDAGQKLFDTELHGGNVLDWHLQNGAGERLATGSYACVLTTKSLSGRLSQRVGLVAVNDQKVTVEGGAALSTAQQETIGPVEGNAALTVLQQSEAAAITAVTHDGTDGELSRTRGALSFRMGDFFAGTDKEQMRLTEEGNLGLGTDKPQAKLDVAGDVHATGTIRASNGIEFADGTVQTTGLSGRKDKDGNLMPNVAGTGTQNRLAKWTDNAGTLGNSNVTEAASGKLGIGTVNPNYEITLFGNDVGLQLISAATGTTANDGFRFGISSVNNAFLWNTEATDMYFGTTATERMRIKATGNVGIGTSAPTERLHVVGNGLVTGNLTVNGTVNATLPAGSANYIQNSATQQASSAFNISGNGMAAGTLSANAVNAATQYNIGNDRVLSVAGSSNVFAGVGAGQANTTGWDNSFFGTDAGRNNTTGGANSFFGTNVGKNSTGTLNSFFGNSAGYFNSGNSNSFFGYKAGASNSTGSNNTIIGSEANVGSGNLSNATAIGARAFVTQSDSLVLGSITGFNGATADTRVGIGTPAPNAVLNVIGSQPPESQFPTDATPALRVIGGQGSNALLVGGSGAFVHIQAGDGGHALTNGGGGNGGSITLRPGAPGNGTPAGAAGNVLLAPSVGNVGIGTSSPKTQLHVQRDSDIGASWANAQLRISGTTDANMQLSLGYDTANNRGVIQAGQAFVAFKELLLNPNGGNVGIGTNAPNAKLQITGGDAAINSQGNGLILRATNGPNCFRLTVDNGGAVSTALVACP